MKSKKLLALVLSVSMLASMFMNAIAGSVEYKEGNRTIGCIELTFDKIGASTREYTVSEWVDNNLGHWEYGVTDGVARGVFSNLLHTTKVHRTSCELGGKWGYSGPQAAGVIAKSSVVNVSLETAHAYYSYDD